MIKTYTTSQAAKIIGVHPNTVRFYEKLGLIPKAERANNGYRIFTELHIRQMMMIRTAFKVEILQNGLRKQIIDIVKASAAGMYDEALLLTENYIKNLQKEKNNANEAIDIVNKILSSDIHENSNIKLTQKEMAQYLEITIDTLRNWELNGLFVAKRKENGYRIYTSSDLNLLKIIRTLRCANYSLASILRMMNTIRENPNADIRSVMDTPSPDDDIITACDKLLSSLSAAENNAKAINSMVIEMKKYNPPL